MSTQSNAGQKKKHKTKIKLKLSATYRFGLVKLNHNPCSLTFGLQKICSYGS